MGAISVALVSIIPEYLGIVAKVKDNYEFHHAYTHARSLK
jgi:hypothetical protein